MRIAVEALPFAVVLLVAGAIVWWLYPPAATVPVVLLAFTLWFFRDPERRAPEDPTALISPADGRIIQAGPRRVSVFMNVFNVPVCRSPIAGRVLSVEHRRGRFLAAFDERAPEQNERAEIRLKGERATLSFTLVAGLIARRIVCKVRADQSLNAGERIGLIRFGSRVDVSLPAGAETVVRVGDRVRAGESVLATLSPGGGRPPER